MYVFFFSSREAECSGPGGQCRLAAAQKVPVSMLAIRSSPHPCKGHLCEVSSSPCSCGLSAMWELAATEEKRSFLGTGGDIGPGTSKVVAACSGGGWVSWPVWWTVVA